MTGVAYRYTIQQDTLGPGLAGLLAAGRDLSEPMDAIGLQLVASTIQRFETEAGPDGRKWEPSARARTTGGKTLTDRGHLRASLTHRADAESVEWGTNMLYARIHQTGGRIEAKAGKALRFPIGDGWATVKAVNIPARPFIGFDDDDRDLAEETLADHLRDGAAGAAGAGGVA
jgi:phage virion morphogenesis protein